MKKIAIKPKDGFSSVSLPGNYQISAGKSRILVTPTEFVEVSDYDKDVPIALSTTFGPKKQQLDISYEEGDENMKKVVEIFYGEHPMISKNGLATKFTRVPIFDMVDVTEKADQEFKVWEEKLKVMNKVNKMGDHDLRDVMYYYGIEPSGKTRGMIIMTLADPINGILLSEVTTSAESKFLKVFAESKNEALVSINVTKAIFMGIIENRMAGDRSNYYLGQELIGTSTEDVISYMNREQRTYNEFILRKVSELEAGLYGSSPKKEEKDLFDFDLGKSAAAPTTQTPPVPPAPVTSAMNVGASGFTSENQNPAAPAALTDANKAPATDTNKKVEAPKIKPNPSAAPSIS